MLNQMLAHPEMIGMILKNTPTWVWGLFAGLAWLGLSQTRDRTASLARVSFVPIAMTLFSIWGMVAAFGNAPAFGYVMLVWLCAAAVVLSLFATREAPAGSSYDAASRTFTLRGSWVPMAIILGIFLTKYIVGVSTSINPTLVRDSQFSLAVGAIYGLFTGMFVGRAARLWFLAGRATRGAIPA